MPLRMPSFVEAEMLLAIFKRMLCLRMPQLKASLFFPCSCRPQTDQRSVRGSASAVLTIVGSPMLGFEPFARRKVFLYRARSPGLRLALSQSHTWRRWSVDGLTYRLGWPLWPHFLGYR